MQIVEELIAKGHAYKASKGEGEEVVLLRIASHCSDENFLESCSVK